MTVTGHNPGVHAHTSSFAEASTRVAAATGQIATAIAGVQPRDARFFGSSPALRRVAFVIGYEALSLLFTILVLGALLGHGGGESTLTAVLVTLTATAWNYVWNLLYEAIERRRGARGRGFWSRTTHAFGYEGGVLIFTIPLVAMTLGVGLLEALAIEGGLLVFFLIFTLGYTWAFDRVCGLPASAR